MICIKKKKEKQVEKAADMQNARPRREKTNTDGARGKLTTRCG